jgi:hypothetical protein
MVVMDRRESGRLGWEASREKLQAQLDARISEAKAKSEGKKCANCGKPLPYEKRRFKTCSQKCSGRARFPRPPKFCFCGAEIVGKDAVSKQTCSFRCATDKKYRDYIARWLNGEESGGTWSGVSGWVRRWLVEQNGEKCSKCGWAERHPKTNRVPIQTDHADGDPYNHRPENLRLVCPNCHSLTETFGNLNKGNGRRERKRRLTMPL